MISKILRHRRISLLMALCVVYSLVILVSLMKLQIMDHGKYLSLADTQHWFTQELLSERGRIFSSDQYELASNENAYLLYVEPGKVSDPKNVAHEIINVIGVSHIQGTNEENESLDDEAIRELAIKDIEDRIGLDLKWVALFHKITEVQKVALMEKNLAGIGFEKEPRRIYPEGEMASHVLGYVANDYSGENVGYFGLEGYYNGDLIGRGGELREERTATGKPILLGKYKQIRPIDGADLELTLNRSVQKIVEKHLAWGVDYYQAESGSVVIIDPKTGAIISMANYPTFNPSNPFEGEETEENKETESKTEKRNLAIADVYEPGSVIKPFTVAAALDLELITPQDKFLDDKPIVVGEYVVDNWDGSHHGLITVTNIVEISNNIGAAKIGQLVGAENLYKYFKDFGFGVLTGIDLEGEEEGILKTASGWREIDLLTASFGQGMSTTPLQVTRAFSVFANKGILMKPYIVSEIWTENETIHIYPEEERQVIKEDTAKKVEEMLIKVVEYGNNSAHTMRDYTIAGKTGTAQISIDGKYTKTETNASFIGYLVEDPRFVMLVKLERPKRTIYGAETAFPIWMKIAEDLVIYYGIPADKY